MLRYGNIDLRNDAHPVKVRRIRAPNALDHNAVRTRSAETRQLDSITLRQIPIPIVPSKRETNRLRRTAIDTDRRQTLVVAAAQIADLTIDVVKAHDLSSLAGADVAQGKSAVGRAAEVADLVSRCAARAGLDVCTRSERTGRGGDVVVVGGGGGALDVGQAQSEGATGVDLLGIGAGGRACAGPQILDGCGLDAERRKLDGECAACVAEVYDEDSNIAVGEITAPEIAVGCLALLECNWLDG